MIWRRELLSQIKICFGELAGVVARDRDRRHVMQHRAALACECDDPGSAVDIGALLIGGARGHVVDRTQVQNVFDVRQVVCGGVDAEIWRGQVALDGDDAIAARPVGTRARQSLH